MFTRDEVDAIVAEAWSYNHDGYTSYHLAVLKRHLAKFNSLKRQSSKEEHWSKVEHEAYLLRKWLPNLRRGFQSPAGEASGGSKPEGGH